MDDFDSYLERQLQDPEVRAAYEAEQREEPTLTPWPQVREAMFESMDVPRRVWEKALAAARVRYRSEIRKYRGIDRLRAMYRRRNR